MHVYSFIKQVLSLALSWAWDFFVCYKAKC